MIDTEVIKTTWQGVFQKLLVSAIKAKSDENYSDAIRELMKTLLEYNLLFAVIGAVLVVRDEEHEFVMP